MSALVLDVSGQPRQFQEGDVDTVEKRGPDSLKNGALIGLGVGGGLAVLFVGAALSAGEDGGGWYLMTVPAYAGMGAGIGVGIDALIEGRRVIYAGSHQTKSNVSVSPILGRERKGVRLSMTF
jgi:hypothetical protein